MNSNHFQNHGCCGSHHNSSGCHGGCTGKINCNFGPFKAGDAACIKPHTGGEQGKRAHAGFMIPHSSGTEEVVLTETPTGSAGDYSLIGFGTAVNVTGPLPAQINGATLIEDEAYSVSQTGAITAIAATFTQTLGFDIGNRVVIVNARVYKAFKGSNTFNPTNATVDLEPITSVVANGDIFQGERNIFPPVPINVGDRLLLVISMTEQPGDASGELAGKISAAITIV